jgi:anti-sigma regulatory factor (Ser/Thr protein kinase)
LDEPAACESDRVHELAQVPTLRARFVGCLQRAGLDADEVQGWELIFTELVNNAIEHGCLNSGDVVGVRWRIAADAVSVVVTDPGPSNLTAADFDEASCDAFADTGRGAGLFLIRAWADEISVRHGMQGGTEIEVVKRRAAPQTRGTEL